MRRTEERRGDGVRVKAKKNLLEALNRTGVFASH